MNTYELHTQKTLKVCAIMNYEFEAAPLGPIEKY